MTVRTLIPLPEAAAKLLLGYRRAYEHALSGRFGPVERRGGRLFVDAAAVERLVLEQPEPQVTEGG